MQILHNTSATMAAVQQGINSSNYQKNAKKLGSGYRINSAADDAAQLSISEKMRSQIRGLNRAVYNAEEGANLIQVADGAMNEIHSMLHRMRELTVQSLNDTNTPQDRAAMALEFNKLQSEIDRIDTNTYYNTLPVFQEHEASYYQIAGYRSWASDQKHSIIAPDNSLNIHLPAGEYSPDSYTIQIPEGIYTTQELVDEIDDAFAAMQPSNPGFVLEYTQDGRCNLNFEGQNGQPAKIDSVDGSLAYLIYDCYSGLSSTSLLGTTVFEGNWPLKITTGQNDQLEFTIEPLGSPAGNPIEVTIEIPQGEYTRSEVIDLINKKLEEDPDVNYPEIKATEYGSNCIQITGGYDNSITRLKGNMFKLELGTEHVYSSVFYDNIRYGTSTGTHAVISGKSYYHEDYTNPIQIKEHVNDELKLKVNGKDMIFIIPEGDYIIDDITNDSKDNITYVLQQLFDLVHADLTVSAQDTPYDELNHTYVSYKYLSITSKTAGANNSLTFDTDDNNIYGKTFASLFTTTNYAYTDDPYYRSGSTDIKITGSANLSGTITIPNGANTLSISVSNNPAFSITIPPRTYKSLNDLVSELNKQLPSSQKNLIAFDTSGSQLVIKALTADVTDIGLNGTGAYKQLFTGITHYTNDVTASATGEEHYPQGSTAPDIKNMASVTLNKEIPESSTTIGPGNNVISFYLNGSRISVTMADGTYSRQGLIDELNRNFDAKGYKVQASLTGKSLTLTTTLSGFNQNLSLEVDTRRYGNAWSAFVGTYPSTVGPSTPKFSRLEGTSHTLPITLDSTNNEFYFQLSDSKSPTPTKVTLSPKTYNSLQELASDLQVVIDSTIGKDKITITYDSDSITMSAIGRDGNFDNPASIPNNTFYDAVFANPISGTHIDDPDDNQSSISGQYFNQGDHDYDKAFIIGRCDIANNTTEIVSGMNDTFILDFTHKNNDSPPDPSKDFTIPLEVTIPAGIYTGTEIADLLTPALNQQLKNNNLDGFTLKATVGGYHTGVTGAIDDFALQITLTETPSSSSASGTIESDPGTYILDGVHGNAASSIFYKTSGKPEPSYITGSHDISGGVTFPPGKNTLTLKTDGIEHSYTFPDESYPADKIVEFLNDKFDNGDDNGNPAPLRASLVNGRLQIKHKVIGSHIISEVNGSAKGILFYMESGRTDLDAFMLQVGALGHQGLELPRLRVGTAALKINSVTISKPKYAEKALKHLDQAVNLLSERRTTYGVLQNRIDYLNSNNRNASINTQASESRMRDADMAAEMMDYTKHKLLADASSSMLAQANQLPKRLINLLTQ